jgi:hypothetical protein
VVEPVYTALPKFYGWNWEEFISHFETLAVGNYWTENEKLGFLLAAVEGSARMHAVPESGKPYTYKTVRDRLDARYSVREAAYIARNRIREARRGDEETIGEFVDRLKQMGYRSNLEPNEQTELFYEAFVRASNEIHAGATGVRRAKAQGAKGPDSERDVGVG